MRKIFVLCYELNWDLFVYIIIIYVRNMFTNMLRVAVTSAKELEHPFNVRPLYTNTDDSATQLLHNLFTEPAYHLDYSMCLILFTLCCAEVFLLKILLTIAEENVLVASFRRQHIMMRRRMHIAFTLSGGSNTTTEEDADNALGHDETESEIHSTNTSVVQWPNSTLCLYMVCLSQLLFVSWNLHRTREIFMRSLKQSVVFAHSSVSLFVYAICVLTCNQIHTFRHNHTHLL